MTQPIEEKLQEVCHFSKEDLQVEIYRTLFVHFFESNFLNPKSVPIGSNPTEIIKPDIEAIMREFESNPKYQSAHNLKYLYYGIGCLEMVMSLTQYQEMIDLANVYFLVQVNPQYAEYHTSHVREMTLECFCFILGRMDAFQLESGLN
jgi:hypothetical protein